MQGVQLEKWQEILQRHTQEINENRSRLNELENMMMRVLYVQQETQMEIKRLAYEMDVFKDEMKVFKDEMLVFKNEMKMFKDEMLAFKDETKMFKDEMLAFKDEMKAFKDEMRAFKDEMKVFKDEIREDTRKFKQEMNRRWGELARKMGTVVEDIVAPGLPYAIKKSFGLEVEDLMVRRKKRRGEKRREYDVIAVADDFVFVVDVKNKYKSEYLHDFREALVAFYDFFPEFQEKTLRPVIASFCLDRDIVNMASKRGLLALQLGGEYLEFVNLKEVQRFVEDRL